ncbi:MAG: glutamate 5-kinase [Dehalococcoidia bacterium]|nr:glutamate 5-kinase [Dehalococcoidia bacterium]
MNTSTIAYKRIVLKFGTSLLTGGHDHLDMAAMTGLISQVATLHSLGAETVIVTSGAVAAGRHKLKTRPDLCGVPLRQVLAAVGQAHLMQIYEDLFEKHGIIVAQALLTKTDLADRSGYLNARNTFTNLLELGIVSIVNENDVVATDELEEARFGDNDNLSAMVANLVDADLLLILTDIAGLYTSDPHNNPDAVLIPEVRKIDITIENMAGNTKGKLGTGGMNTKIEAARLATASGVNVIIADGGQPDIILRLMRGESIGTHFIPSTTRLESRQRWMLSGLSTHGSLIIDSGASEALISQNKSLLPAGIRQIEGKWQRGDIVDIIDNGVRIGSGIVNYDSIATERIKGLRSSEIGSVLGYSYGASIIHRNNMTLLPERRDHGSR